MINWKRFNEWGERAAPVVPTCCPTREATLAAMRLLGVEAYEDWTSEGAAA